MALFVLGGAVPCFPSIPSYIQQCAGSSRWQLWDCHQGGGHHQGGDHRQQGTTSEEGMTPKEGIFARQVPKM